MVDALLSVVAAVGSSFVASGSSFVVFGSLAVTVVEVADEPLDAEFEPRYLSAGSLYELLPPWIVYSCEHQFDLQRSSESSLVSFGEEQFLFAMPKEEEEVECLSQDSKAVSLQGGSKPRGMVSC